MESTPNPNGRPSINCYRSDMDGPDTAYGTHNRIVVLREPDGSLITAREDDIGLRSPSDAERRKVMQGWQRLHPRKSRLRYVGSSEPYRTPSGWWSVDHEYAAHRT